MTGAGRDPGWGGPSRAPLAAALAALYLLGGGLSHALPVTDQSSGLPIGSELDEDAIQNPREVFHSEVTQGQRSYLSSLGNLAFNSPAILGAAARRAHISCGTCHVNGATNPRFFIPGLSSRPGTFDTTNALFDPQSDNHVLDAVTIPSLRGARLLAPYGHDGRFATLKGFVRHAIVSEFAGPVPSPQILDALVAYIEDIDFLDNPALDAQGRLTVQGVPALTRGEQLFRRPFPHARATSCATCHVPTAAFVDHLRHDVGSGGLYKTPTLLNADFNAAYFHDGRYSDYGQVIDHFDRVFGLGLTAQDRSDLIAYLQVIGGGVQPEYRLTGPNVLEDSLSFARVLEVAIPQHDRPVIALAVATVGEQLQDLKDHYPDPARDADAGGVAERQVARAAVGALIAALHQVGVHAAAGQLDAAAADYLHFRKLAAGAVPVALLAAERWSLFSPVLHAAWRAAALRAAAGRLDRSQRR